jgi:hypothetical protein
VNFTPADAGAIGGTLARPGHKRPSGAERHLGMLDDQAEQEGLPVPRNRAVYRLICDKKAERGFGSAKVDVVRAAAEPAATPGDRA